jgi:hypothetical protein
VNAPLPPDEIAGPRALRAERWILLVLRLTQIGLLTWIALTLPVPALEQGLPLKAPLVVLAAILLTGKAFYDTLFYSRFRP